MIESSAPSPEADVLRQNAAFYRAFSRGDYDAMRELWAEGVVVTCLHPLAPPLVGREEVLESWRRILREAPSLEMRCDDPVVSIAGDMALVLCYEANGNRPAHLAATNVFVHQHGRWRMVHHQAGPLEHPVPRPTRETLN